ncbi:MAG: APC family permease [Actinobacteria bacterium]|nr:APC family permease [Actinomycetota bacterium]
MIPYEQAGNDGSHGALAASQLAGQAGSFGSAGPKLRRALGLWSATATSSGLAFAAMDYLAVVSVATYAAGTSAWLAILVAGVLALLVAGIFSELNGLYPSAAGIRLYMSRAMGNRTALSVTFAYMTTIVAVIAADAFLIGAAIQHVLHEPTVLAYVWIVVLVGMAITANLLGVKLTGAVQNIVTYTVLASTTALSLVAIFNVPGPLRRPLALLHAGPHNAIEAVAYGVFLYAAFEWVTTTAEEVRSPATTSKALFIAPGILFVVTAVFALALTHAVPFASSHHSPYPQLLLGRAALGEIGELWMLATTVLTAINTFNGGFLTASRFLYAAARDGNLPRVFCSLNLKAVPWFPVLVLGATSALVAAAVFLTRQWLLLVAVGATLEALIYACAAWCVLALRRRDTRKRSFYLPMAPVLCVAGMVIFAVLGLASAFSNPANPSRLSVLPAAVVAVIGCIATAYVLIAIPKLQAKAAARARAAQPRRRPMRTISSEAPSDSGSGQL